MHQPLQVEQVVSLESSGIKSKGIEEDMKASIYQYKDYPKKPRTSLTLCVTWCMLLTVVLSACAGFGGSNQNPSNPTGNQQVKPVQTPPGPSIQCTSHSSNPVTITMYYGSEKQAWISDVVADFNSHNYAACDGPITVKATPIGSGQSMQEILNGTIQPDIWSPAGSVWLTLINAQWREKTGSDLVSTSANDTPSLVSSPIVVAMWKPMAQALGWPNKPIGWADIAKLSTNPKGWAAYGHPEFGDFKFGHTHPDYSNSGLDAVIAMNYAAVGKVRGLTTGDVTNPSTQSFLNNVESSVIHYGDSTGFFANKMFSKGPSYLSAAVLYESSVIQANDGKTYPNLAYPVVAIYPKEGTFYSDHPYAILQANWVTPAKKAAAQAFRNFLLDAPQQQKALQYGFRPADPNISLGVPIDNSHGVDPGQPKTLLQIPTADTVRAVINSWNQQKRKVDVTLILDRSGSMAEQIGGIAKIDAAKQGMKQFVNLLSDDDALGLTVFSDSSVEITPVTPLGPKRQDVLNRIDNIIPGGSTRLFDTIAEQVQALQAMPSKNIKAVVVLTDGIDNLSQLNLDQLVNQISASGENAGNAVKVFTIAYGSDANANALTKIASATGGQEYAGTPQNIQQVYIQISTFF
jgi:Ca-activated chloride channel homolog